MSFDDALDVPEPKSPASTSATASPARAACAAVAAPITPPPITSRSNAVRVERLARGGPARVRVIVYAHSGFVHARRPAGSTTSSRAKGGVAGQVEPRRDDEILGRDLEDLRSVAVAQPARVHRRPARPPGQQRDRAGGRAPYDHVAVTHLDVVDQRTGAAVEPSRAQSVEDALRGLARRGSTSTRDPSRSPDGGCRRSRGPGQIRPSSSSSSQCTDDRPRPTSSSHPALNTSIPVTDGGSSSPPGRAPVQYGCAR